MPAVPSGVVASPSIANVRTYHDVLFYIDGAVTVTFIPDTGVSLFVPGQVAAAESYAVAGPRRGVLIQARATNYRVLD